MIDDSVLNLIKPKSNQEPFLFEKMSSVFLRISYSASYRRFFSSNSFQFFSPHSRKASSVSFGISSLSHTVKTFKRNSLLSSNLSPLFGSSSSFSLLNERNFSEEKQPKLPLIVERFNGKKTTYYKTKGRDDFVIRENLFQYKLKARERFFNFLRSCFLPYGYPYTVSGDWVSFYQWTFIQV